MRKYEINLYTKNDDFIANYPNFSSFELALRNTSSFMANYEAICKTNGYSYNQGFSNKIGKVEIKEIDFCEYMNIGDVEKVDEELFIRLNYTEVELEKINEILRSNLSMTEWITIVYKKDNTCKIIQYSDFKVVAYSEKDNKEYNLTNYFTLDELKWYLENAISTKNEKES
jgi:hypothetical protein